MDGTATIQNTEREEALLYEGTWYDAIKTKDIQLLRNLIHIRGFHQLLHNCALLHHAVTDGNKQVVELFISHGADVNAFDTAYSRITPLMEAVSTC